MKLYKVRFFKPLEGSTLREQLQGKTLVGAEVVEYLRSLGEAKDFVPPSHWEKPFGVGVYGFSLTHLTPRYADRPEMRQEPSINGFVWTNDEGFLPNYRHFKGEPLDMVVGKDWHPKDWILIESE